MARKSRQNWKNTNYRLCAVMRLLFEHDTKLKSQCHRDKDAKITMYGIRCELFLLSGKLHVLHELSL